MQHQRYTFEDWYQGKVYLYQSRIFNNQDATIVDWNSFTEEDKSKIKDFQKSFFEQSVKQTSKLYIKQFLSNFKSTKSKIDLLNTLIKRYYEVFNGKMICDGDYCHSSDRDLNYEFWYYQEMRVYIDQVFIGGNEYDFSNVHSPYSKFWDGDKIMPEVCAEALGSLIKVLLTQKSKLTKSKSQVKTPVVPNIQQEDSIETERINPFPDIFSSYNAFLFFLDLESSTVRTKPLDADYCFIFHKLKDPKIGYPIKQFVGHPQFCDFLFAYKGITIQPKYLKKRDPASKQSAFKVALEKFQANNSQQEE